MVMVKCHLSLYQELESIQIISMKSNGHILHLSTFSDSNSFMMVKPGCLCDL